MTGREALLQKGCPVDCHSESWIVNPNAPRCQSERTPCQSERTPLSFRTYLPVIPNAPPLVIPNVVRNLRSAVEGTPFLDNLACVQGF